MNAERVEPAQRIDAQNPWPGLDAFDENAAQFFNGRENESAEVAHLIGQATLTVLFGKSGLGKTSLLKAGVFPLLRGQGLFPVYVRLAVLAREGSLIEQLTDALLRDAGERRVEVTPREFKGTTWERLHHRDFALWSTTNRPLTPLFVIDQFEEVFTLGAARRAAIERLRIDLADLVENRIPAGVVRALETSPDARALETSPDARAKLDTNGQRYKLLISFREDFLPEVESWRREIPSLMRNRFRLMAMNAEQAFKAVYKTGAAARLVDESTAREIVSFVGRMQSEDGGGAGGGRGGPGGPGERSVSANATASTAGHIAGPDDDFSSPATREGDAFTGHEIEPALLSLVCAELNRRRQSGPASKPAIDVKLLRETGASIISDFYVRQVAKVPEATRRFIEDELLTEGGYRNSFPLEEALKQDALTDDVLRRLIDGRVLRIEQQLGIPRVELTHDRLTDVVRHERDQRRERDLSARRRRRLKWIGLGGAAAFALVLVASFNFVAQLASEKERQEAERQRDIAQKALAAVQRERDEAGRQRALAEEARRAAEEALQRAEEERAHAEKQRALAELRQKQVIEEQERTRAASQRADAALDRAQEQNLVLGELFAPVRPGVLRIESKGKGISTGFFVTRSGLAVTPGHVVRPMGEQPVKVANFEGKGFEASIVRLEHTQDLALLQVRGAAPSHCLRFVDERLKAGTLIVALSISPRQDWVANTGKVLRLDVSIGNVVGLGKDGGAMFAGKDLIEIDMKTTGGFSGAPVLDPYARRVVGIGAYAKPNQEPPRHYLIPASRIRTVFAKELAGDACPG
jgi:S1-C subfamily serine protease